MDELLTLSGTRLAEMIRKGEATSLEVVEAHIARIRKVNPSINAMVKDRFDPARAEADKADELRRTTAAEKLPPFHGVPCTIKECFTFTGMPTTSGLVSRRGNIASEDATGVRRLRAAGAIPLGVTNVPELCMWMETYNNIYGRTKNPYDRRRIAGGSSGGEGAVIGAGGSPFGLGSDIGGSIRMPAFFNGVFGHKPTGGMVPNTGHFPLPGEGAFRYLCTGPLARRAEDLMPLVRILAGPDGRDPSCTQPVLRDPSGVRMSDVTVLVVEDNGAVRVSKDLREAQRRCADALAERGAQVKKTKIEGLEKSFWIWGSMLSSAGGPTYSELLGNGRPIRPLVHLMKWCISRSPHTLPSIVLALLEKLPKYTPSRSKKFVDRGRALKDELIGLIGPSGVMLYPPYSRPAPFHNRPLLKPFDWVYTAILNVMEFPVTQVPLGLNEEGVPLGVQVAAVPGNDHLTIAVALELERIFGGWVPPRTPE